MVLLATLPPAWADSASTRKPLRIAANPNVPHEELIANFGPFATALEIELGQPVELVSGKDYADTTMLLKTGKVDIAGSGAFGYVSAQADFGAKVLVRYVEGTREYYRALIITRVESGIRSPKDLRGKRFAFTDRKSTSGYLMPLLELERNGVAESDLAQALFVKEQPKSALAVFTREADAGAIADNQLNEKYGVKLGEIRTLWESEPIYHGVWMVRPETPEAEIARLRAAILRVSASPNAINMFHAGSVKGFVMGKDSDFDNVRAAKRRLDQLEAATHVK
jgi:phosphonate transport system substrate-binding protein